MSVVQGSPQTFVLLPQHTLSVTAGAAYSANVFRFVDHVGDTPGVTAVAGGTTVTIGPFAVHRRYQVDPRDGVVTVSISPVDYPTATEAADAAAAADFRIVGTIGDLCEVIGEGAPASSVQASLSVNPTGDENALTYTAVVAGAGGNAISIEYVDPGVADSPLSVSVSGTAITVSLETDSGSSIVSTAAEVLAAIEGSAAASALVGVAIDASDSGGSDDGSGTVTAMALDNLESGAGVAAGTAGIGSRYTDVTNGALYINTGTKNVPVWTQLAEAS